MSASDFTGLAGRELDPVEQFDCPRGDCGGSMHLARGATVPVFGIAETWCDRCDFHLTQTCDTRNDAGSYAGRAW